jgi:VanZ family protein
LTRTNSRRQWQALLLLMMLASCFIAFDPAPRPVGVTHGDKLQHLVAFAALGLVARLALQRAPVAGLAMLGFGIFIEAVQHFIPTRSASLGDVVADAAGVVLGLLLARALGLRHAAAGAEKKSTP